MSEATIRDAATLIIVERREGSLRVLMGRRHASHKFMPDKFVFPGGAVDAADRRMAVAHPLEPAVAAKLLAKTRRPSRSYAQALALAAIRETFEETGLALGVAGPTPAAPAGGWARFAATGVRPSLAGLDLLARAITPPGRPRRFDARFFVADAAEIAHRAEGAAHEGAELTELVWAAIEEALTLDIPSITRMVLGNLAALGPRPWDPGRPRPFYRMLRGKHVTEAI